MRLLREHLIRRSGHIVQDRLLWSLRWADIPQLSTRVGRCPAAWQQYWQQSQAPSRLNRSGLRVEPDRDALATRRVPRGLARSNAAGTKDSGPAVPTKLDATVAYVGKHRA